MLIIGTLADQQQHTEHIREREIHRHGMSTLISKWLESLDVGYFSDLQRSDSYHQHLAGKFFAPDAGGFKLPRPSLEVVKAMGRAMKRARKGKRQSVVAGNGRVFRRGAVFMAADDHEGSDRQATMPASEGRRQSVMGMGRRDSMFPGTLKEVVQSDEDIRHDRGEGIFDTASLHGWEPVSRMSTLTGLSEKGSLVSGSPQYSADSNSAVSPLAAPLTPARVSGEASRPVSAIPYSQKRPASSILHSLKAQSRPLTAYRRSASASSRSTYDPHLITNRDLFRRLDSGRSAFREEASTEMLDDKPARPQSGPWSAGWRKSGEAKVAPILHDKPFRM